MLKIKITGSNLTERQLLQKMLSRYLREANLQIVESEKRSSGIRQVVTSPIGTEKISTTIVLVECDNVTEICCSDKRLVARATGAEDSIKEFPSKQYHVMVKREGRAPHQRIVTASNSKKAIEMMGDLDGLQSITVKAM